MPYIMSLAACCKKFHLINVGTCF